MCVRAENLSRFQDAFAPMPLKSQEELDNFYVNTADARTGDECSDFVKSVAQQLEDCQETCLHKLFIGHPGCGKTTELYQLMRVMDGKGFLTCLGRCDLELDSGDVEYHDVLFLILELLVRTAKANHLKIDKCLIREIYEYWEQDITEIQLTDHQEELAAEGGADGEITIPLLLHVLAKVKGVIKNSSETRKEIRRHIEPRSSELVQRIQDVIEAISREWTKDSQGLRRKMPLIILDGLDKIPLEQARKIFGENGARFTSLRAHLLLTFPIALAYTPEYNNIQVWFPNPEKLPMIKLRNWSGGRDYEAGYTKGTDSMRELVEKRANLELFDEGVLDRLIRDTGGYIRDLFRCIADAATRARLRQSTTVDMKDAEIALDKLESDINGRYQNSMIGIMQRIYDGEKAVASSEEMTILLQGGVVLEYNGKRWCDLHPLVEKWLKEHKKIS